jgi:uncharacterized protein YfaP (DUF2135 family)
MSKIYSLMSYSTKFVILFIVGFVYQAAYAASLDFSETVHGYLSTQSKSWVTHTFKMDAPGLIDISLDWDQDSANMNLFLYDPNGELVQYVNTTTTKPKQIEFDAHSTGEYKIGIKCKEGDANYRLNLSVDLNKPLAKYPAQPQPGMLYWGAAVSSNTDPKIRHEIPAGKIMGLRRTFFNKWSKREALIKMASSDLQVGRLPWVSIKTPLWTEMADGLHDNEIDEMLKGLDALPGPVWLTMHHEPEGGNGSNTPDYDCGASGHLAMNRHVRERMNALGVDNVALAPILMGYTWNTKSGRNPDEWWEPGIYDFIGVDPYQKSDASLVTPVWMDIRQWAAARGVDVAVGEWGLHGTDEVAGSRVKEWYEHAANSNKDGVGGGRVVALSAFDSNLNSDDGGWELQGAQLTTFHELMNDPRTAFIKLDSSDLNKTLQGSLSSQSKSWLTRTFKMDAPGLIDIFLDWDQDSANMNLFLYDPNGELVQYVNTTATKPKRIEFDAHSTGEYKIGIKCKEGDANYHVDLNVSTKK